MQDGVKMYLLLVASIVLIGLVVIFFFVRGVNRRMNTTWLHQRVTVPAIAMQGEVIGWTSTRENYFLKIRLDNGNAITLSTDQAVLVPIPLTDREKEIKMHEDALKSLKGTK